LRKYFSAGTAYVTTMAKSKTLWASSFKTLKALVCAIIELALVR
jgi:hypothetical protein